MLKVKEVLEVLGDYIIEESDRKNYGGKAKTLNIAFSTIGLITGIS